MPMSDWSSDVCSSDRCTLMGYGSSGTYRRHQLSNDVVDMAGKFGLLFKRADRCTYSATAAMPQHHNQWRMQNCNAILQAGQNIAGNIIARHTRNKQVTPAFVKT